MALPTTGLTLRLESDAGVTYDANGVSAWADQSAAAFPDFVQATDANKPARLTGVFGTLPGIYFDGTSDFMASTGLLSALLSASAFEALFVVKPIRNGTINSIATANGLITGNNAAPQVSLCKCGLTTQVGLGNSIKPAGTYVNSAQASILDGKSYMMGVTFNGTNWSTFNPITRSLDLADTTCAAIAGLTQSVLMGKSGDGNVFFKGYVAGIYLWSAQLTTKQRTDAWEYAKAKFSVTVPHVFVDGSMADDTSTDPKMTTAHQLIRTAITKYSGYYGTRIVCRRTIAETIAGSMLPTGNSTDIDPITVMGMPRNEITGLTGNFTQGSRSVSSVSGATLSTRAHETRWITAPDGRLYRISCVTGTNAFNMFTPYIGANSTGGTFKINKDELYDEVQTLTAYDGADALATWNADAHDRPLIQQPASSYYLLQISTTQHNWTWRDLYLLNTRASYGINSTTKLHLIGITIESSVNGALCTVNGLLIFDGFTLKGTIGAAGTQDGFLSANGGIGKWLQGRDISIYGMSRNSLVIYASDSIDIVNALFGADLASWSTREIILNTNTNQNIRMYLENALFSNGTEIYTTSGLTNSLDMLVFSKNHNQIKDYHKYWNIQAGTILTNTGSGVSLRNSANCSFALECLFNIGRYVGGKFSGDMRKRTVMVFEHRIRLSQLKNYRVYVNSDDYLSSSNLWLEMEYVDANNGTSLHNTLVKSSATQEILPRTGESDWSQYVEITGIQPSVESEVVVRLFISYYHPTNKIFVDPYIDDIGIAPTVFQGMANISQKYSDKIYSAQEEIDRNDLVPENKVIREADGGPASYKHLGVVKTPSFNLAAAESDAYNSGVIDGEANNSFTGDANDIITSETLILHGTSIPGEAIRETHTADEVVHSAGGNFIDETIIPDNLKVGITAGLGVDGNVIPEAHTADEVIHSAGGNFIDETIIPENLKKDVVAGISVVGILASGGDLPAPSASVLTAVPASAHSIDISWTPSAFAEKYAISRRLPGGSFARIPDASTYFTAGSYRDTSLTAQTAYIYKVTAINDTDSTDSNEASVMTPAVAVVQPQVQVPLSFYTVVTADNGVEVEDLVYENMYGELSTLKATVAEGETFNQVIIGMLFIPDKFMSGIGAGMKVVDTNGITLTLESMEQFDDHQEITLRKVNN